MLDARVIRFDATSNCTADLQSTVLVCLLPRFYIGVVALDTN